MRQITKESVNAFLDAKPFNKQNMKVEVLPNVTILKLFGNAIAYRYNDPERSLSITNCGWQSNTTKERLNGLLSALNMGTITQRNWEWYLNGKKWSGRLIDVQQSAPLGA